MIDLLDQKTCLLCGKSLIKIKEINFNINNLCCTEIVIFGTQKYNHFRIFYDANLNIKVCDFIINQEYFESYPNNSHIEVNLLLNYRSYKIPEFNFTSEQQFLDKYKLVKVFS